MTVAALFPRLTDTPLPPLRGGQFASTQFDVIPIVMILGALALYLYGVKRVNRLQPRHRWSGKKTAAFVFGLVVTSLAIFSFIGVYDGELFYDHMIQHLMLIMLAAPLFAIGSPLDLLWRATTGEGRVLTKKLLRSKPSQLLGNPLVAFVLYAIVIPVTHLTSFYEYTLTHEEVHNLEHLVFLGVGYLFWRQIFGSEPMRFRLHPALQFGFLFLAVPIDTFTGLSLSGANHELFHEYLAIHRTWGPSLISDLHMGGVIMWIGGDTLMLLPMVPVAIKWMHQEERRAVRVDRTLDAMFPTDRGIEAPTTS